MHTILRDRASRSVRHIANTTNALGCPERRSQSLVRPDRVLRWALWARRRWPRWRPQAALQDNIPEDGVCGVPGLRAGGALQPAQVLGK